MVRGFSTSLKRDDTVYYGSSDRTVCFEFCYLREQANLQLTTFQPRSTDPCYDFIAENPEHGKFTTPNYPANYAPNLRCVRTIPAPPGYNVELSFRGAVFEVGASPAMITPTCRWSPSIGRTRSASGRRRRPQTGTRCVRATSSRSATACTDSGDFTNFGRFSNFSPLLGRFCQITHPYGSITARSGHM